MNLIKTLRKVSAIVCLCIPFLLTHTIAHGGKLSAPIAEAMVEKLKSKDPTVRLEVFNALGIKEPSFMSLMVDAVEGAPCGVEDLEHFVFNDAVSSIIDVLRKQRAKLPNAKQIQKECELLMMGSAQYGF